jgi:hypothetical protein
MAFVELYIEDELMELGEVEIQTDYSIAEIGNFETRNGFRGIDFDLPPTAKNKAVLNNPQEVNNLSVRPYRTLKARLYVNGIDQLIRFCSIENTKDNINVRLFGGNTTFFEAIKKKELTETDLTPFNHNYTLSNIIASRINTNQYVYALIDFHADSPNFIMNNNNIYDVRYTLPIFSVTQLLIAICAGAGYGIQNNIFLSDLQYQSAELMLPIITKDYSKTINTRFNLDAENTVAEAPVTVLAGVVTIDVVFPNYDTIIYDNDNRVASETLNFQISGGTPITRTLNVYNVAATGFYNFELDVNVKYVGTPLFTVAICKVQGGVLTVLKQKEITLPSVVSITDYTITYKDKFEAYQNDKVIVMVYVASSLGGFIQVNNSQLNIIPNSLRIEYGEFMYIQYLLPKLKQSELFKAYLQMYCGLVQVNEFTKLVQINKFDDILANIGNAYDWSDKLDYSENTEIDYELDGYAQNNLLLYEDDDSVIKPLGTDGSITIDDETLEQENELIVLPFAATEQVERLGNLEISQIKLFTTSDDSPPETELSEDVEPRILLLERISGDVDYTDGTTTTTVTTNLPITWFIRTDKTYNLGFDNNLKESYYNLLEGALDKTKIINESIRLTPLDIETIDFLRPVYLDKHNSYFYISKITGYDCTNTLSTQVELVKIK